MKTLLLSVSLLVFASCNSTGGGAGGGSAATVASTTYYAYITNFDDDTVSAYRVNGSSGGLTYLGDTGVNGDRPYGMAVHPNNKFLYIANAGSDEIAVFSINQANGDLTLVEEEATNPSAFPHAMAMNSTGTRLYLANELEKTVVTYSVNATTGHLTFMSSIATGQATGAAPHDVKVVDDQFVYVANYSTNSNSVNAFEIQGDGTLALIEEQASGTRPFKLAVYDNRFLYSINRTSNDVHVFEIENDGSLTNIQIIATGSTPTSIVFRNNFAYVANFTSNDVSVYSVNPTTGMLTAEDYTAVWGGSNPSSLYNQTVGLFMHPDLDWIFSMHKADKKIAAVDAYNDGFLYGLGLEVSTGTNPQWVEFVTIR